MLALALISTGLALVFTIGVHKPGEERQPGPRAQQERGPQPGERAPATAVAAPVDRPRASDLARLDAWVRKHAGPTSIPPRALAAYGRAEMWLRGLQPDCHLSWATLAAIGRVESRHGEIDGAGVRPSGLPTKPIVGPPLDGSPGVRAIRDTDNGRLDGDREWDRAVGPMQFLPATWERWAVRATRDGRPADPQNIDDAAVAAASFLCFNGGDLSTPQGWWDAVLSYNTSVKYGQDVFAGANAYAEATSQG